MRRFLPILAAVFLFAGCSDVLQPPPKQCDAERRCAPADDPVCGDDGEWYPCASQMECVGIEAAPEPFCEDVCGEPTCREGCDIVTGDDGCPQCDCPDDVCPELPRDCETEIGADGCERCVEVDCEPVACRLACPNGFETDADGCEICECKEVTSCNDDLACADGCVPVYDEEGCVIECDCDNECEPFDRQSCLDSGNCYVESDSNGCQICVCEESQCERQFCDNYCEHGYEIVDGCPTCQCHTPCDDTPDCGLACAEGYSVDPLTQCVNSCDCRDECAGATDCALACEYGFKVDEDGCEICECRGEPCQTEEDCALDEHCVLDGSTDPNDPSAPGECVPLQTCDEDQQCPDDGQCGFFFRTDCCPPLTTCRDDLQPCPALCLPQLAEVDRVVPG